ncbi:MAG: YheV family putative metal-binding protein [Chloroflexi bacterium]|nr:YheV family putative metal-binding protein [Chloroflexota bacterium]
MIYFKACPRCQGDMHVVNDLYGRYLECLQCGYEDDLKEERRTAPTIWDVPAAKTKAKSKVKAA